jgi:acetyl/propionyl-CoA carboxylase alpha subunit
LYREPRQPGLRIDAGVAEGGSVSVHYDPMLAKAIASAETRDGAIARLTAALRRYAILGVMTNISFLLRILNSGPFHEGRIDTRFLDREGDGFAEPPPEEIPDFVRAALEAAGDERSPSSRADGAPRSWDPWSAASGWRV